MVALNKYRKFLIIFFCRTLELFLLSLIDDSSDDAETMSTKDYDQHKSLNKNLLSLPEIIIKRLISLNESPLRELCDNKNERERERLSYDN
jgi:hypothetical protein